MGLACMENPLSLWHFYLRNKRKVLPVIGILALAIRGDVVPLGDLIIRVQRLQSEEKAFEDLVRTLTQNPNDPRPLITYVQQHQTWLQSILPDAAQLGRLQSAVTNASSDAVGLQQSLQAMNRDAANLNAAGRSVADIPIPPSPSATIDQFKGALDRLTTSLDSIQSAQPGLDKLVADSSRIPSTAFVKRDAYSNLDINLLAGNAQFDLYGVDQPGMAQLLALYGDRVAAGRLPRPNANEIAVSEEIARSRHVWIGGQLGNNLDELDRLPDAFSVVGIIRGPTRIGVIPLDYMTQHYLFERRYQGLVVVPQSGHEQVVHDQLQKMIGSTAFRLFDWPYIKAKIDSLIQNLDAINRFLVILVTVVLSLVVGLLNNLFFRQRMNEFGLLAALGYSRWGLIRRVAWESLGVTVAAWCLGVGAAIAVLSWFNTSFMVPHGLVMNVFDWNVLLLHTLPIPLMVFLFGMSTVGWQLLRLDPISIIERRD